VQLISALSKARVSTVAIRQRMRIVLSLEITVTTRNRRNLMHLKNEYPYTGAYTQFCMNSDLSLCKLILDGGV
jgi:hypothetical protein